ncbi:GNAT family N-acetyltransferase [Natranaeroarchaeum sulfidigenes]|uniref:Acetyltransferase (GNAT) family n=1 Tax=Natranaeroarchaeum sulfidigenes TaxID=2784880 RepID=A0A897MUK9_9EURY|nr:GNAT family N-acetyltransferase [Natranaeroarchaeum sulfidigenes]QSG02639.1 Acetyltransferase (GNAT) family [Natranaeroarchaeum sulfidigenes]
MHFALLGWPNDGVTLRLDWERFSYAGKFVMSNTGKAVLCEERPKDDRGVDPEDVLAAVAFNEDRTDEGTLWLRYITVRADRRGEGLGPELVVETVDRAIGRGYQRVRIAVNNPFAYEALWKAGFGFTGEGAGIAELVLAYPRSDAIEEHADVTSPTESYRNGIERLEARDGLTETEQQFLAARRDAEPPAPTDRSQ